MSAAGKSLILGGRAAVPSESLLVANKAEAVEGSSASVLTLKINQ